MMRRTLSRCLLFACLTAGPATANIIIVPPVQEVTANRGRAETFSFIASNRGDEMQAVKFEIRNMDITVYGQPYVADSSYDRGCADWITIDPVEAVLEPMKTVDVTATMNVPRDAEGSYYAMMITRLGAENVQMEGTQAGFTIENQAGVVVMVVVNSSQNEAVLYPDTLMVFPRGEQNAILENPLELGGGWDIVLQVRNEGNTHTACRGDLSLWSSGGVRLETVPLISGQGYVLPGRSRQFRAEGSGSLSDGYYLLTFNLRTREGRTITDNVPFAIKKNEVLLNATVDETEALLRAAMPRFRLREPIIRRKLSPGGSSYVAINLQNISEDTLHLKPEFSEWYMDELGRTHFSPNQALHGRSCRLWLALDQEEYVVPPRRSVSVKTRVDAPADSLIGEYYGAVTFRPLDVDPGLLNEFIGSRTQLMILSGPDEGSAEPAIDSILVRKSTADGKQYCDLEFRVRNAGSKYCYSDGTITLEREIAPGKYDLYADDILFGNRQTVVLPNSAHLFQLRLPEMPAGKYRAILRINYEMEQPLYVKSRVFTM